MKKKSMIGATALAALIIVLAALGYSAPAQAYPEVRINLTVSRSVLYSGQTYAATAASNVACDWTLAWNGTVQTGTGSDGKDLQATFAAPQVSKVTKIRLRGTCAYASSAMRPGAGTSVIWKRTVIITVLPQSTVVSAPGTADLPRSGGPNVLFLAGGLGLLLAGATAVSVARRRAEEAEFQAFGA